MDKPILINRDLQSGTSLVNRSNKRKLVTQPSSHSNSSFKLTEMIKNQANENNGKFDWEVLEKLRLKTKKFMSQSLFGLMYENILIVLSIFSCFEYIYSTYLKNYLNSSGKINDILNVIELVLATIFGVDWLLCFFLADHKIIFCSSFFSMVDLFTVIPIYVTFNRDMPVVGEIYFFVDVIIYTMFAMGTTRILRALRMRRKLAKIEDAVQRFLAEMCLSIVVMILFFAACIQFVEYPYQIHHYITWVYMMWVTMATVGYGDITPATTQGRVVIMFIISFSIVIIPKMTNELVEKMKLQTIYARAVYTPLSKKSKHVVICGDISSTSMTEFFDELFHEDHENPDLHAILLLPQPPSVEMILLITNSKFFLSFLYLEGSALIDNDLKRAKIETAEAIFIMTNKFSLKPDEEDAKTILLSLSIKRYIASFDKSINIDSKLFCLQIIRPQNLRHLSSSDDMYSNSMADQQLIEHTSSSSSSMKKDSIDLVVCINEIKMGVLAKGVMYPGANTLLMNLVSSFSEEVDDEDDDTVKPWLKEYQKGCDWEIYSSELSPIFEGTKFSELSYALYDKIGVVLFALQITDKNIKGSPRLLLNPAAFVIPSQQQYEIEAFVIAQNQQSSNLSFNQNSSKSKLHGIEKDLSKAVAVVSSVTNSVNIIGGNTVNAIGGIISNHHEHKNSFVRKESRLSLSYHAPRISTYRIVPTAATVAASITEKLRTKSFMVNGINNNNNSGSESDRMINPNIRTKPSRAKELWKKLKRSSLMKQKVETYSYQEILHKLEDQHWNENYYLREKMVSQKSVTIKTNVIDEIPHINHHLIVIGKGLNNLLDLIQPLRSKHLGILKYIVILSIEELPIDAWQRICMFDAIVLVKGSALEEKNLRRAGIFRASQVVVLADGNRERSANATNAGSTSALVDSDAIFTYQCVKRMNPNTQIIVEIVNSSNISYLDSGDLDSATLAEDNYKFTSQFAAGNLFTTTLLDSVVCQAYYNPSIIKVMKKLLSGVDQAESGELEAKAHHQCEDIEHEAAIQSPLSKKNVDDGTDSNDEKEKPPKLETISKIVRNSMQAVNNDEKIAAANASKKAYISKLKESEIIKSIKGSCLYQMEIPESLGSKKYGEIYQALSLQGIIPLGLLRGTLADMGLGAKQNRYPYVYTNPEKDVEVYKCDKIFVLSTKPVQVSSKVDLKDWLLNIQMQKNKNDAIGATVTTTTSIAKDKRLEHIDLLQKKIDARINKVSINMKKQLNNLSHVIEKCVALTTVTASQQQAGVELTTYNNTVRRGSIESSQSNTSDDRHNNNNKTVAIPSNTNLTENSNNNSNQYRRSSLESAQSNTSALTNNATELSEQEQQLRKNSIKNDQSNQKPPSIALNSSNSNHNVAISNNNNNNNIANQHIQQQSTIDQSPSSSPHQQQHSRKKNPNKSTPLRHLLKELDENFKGPSIKLVMSPITNKRIQKIRAASANYNKRVAPSQAYRALSAGKYREEEHNVVPSTMEGGSIEEGVLAAIATAGVNTYHGRNNSHLSTEAIYYKREDYSDEGSFSDNPSDEEEI